MVHLDFMRLTQLKNMRHPTLMMVCLGIWLLGVGCNRHEETTACPVCGVANWIIFSPAGERFSVLMPTKPTESTTMADTRVGQVPVYYFTARPLKEHSFAVTHSTYPQGVDITDAEKLFNKIEYMTLTTGAQLISKTNITLHGIPGRELIYEKEDHVVSLRIYLIDRDVYQAMSAMPKESNCQKHIHEFLESFQIKQK